MRFSYALWPHAPLTSRLAAAVACLDGVEPMRFVRRDHYHVTLVFAGESTEAGLVDFQRIGRAVHGIACPLSFDALEYWPHPAVVAATVGSPPPALAELCRQLLSELAAVQWFHRTLEEGAARPTLRAHVTLARKVLQPPVLQAMSVSRGPPEASVSCAPITSGTDRFIQ